MLASTTQKNALSVACFYGQSETVKFLLEKGALVEPVSMKYAVEKDFRYNSMT
jgi:ankyrin repeat protein